MKKIFFRPILYIILYDSYTYGYATPIWKLSPNGNLKININSVCVPEITRRFENRHITPDQKDPVHIPLNPASFPIVS